MSRTEKRYSFTEACALLQGRPDEANDQGLFGATANNILRISIPHPDTPDALVRVPNGQINIYVCPQIPDDDILIIVAGLNLAVFRKWIENGNYEKLCEVACAMTGLKAPKGEVE